MSLRRFLRRPIRGVVCYLPGQCDPHAEMAVGELEYWAVAMEDGRMLSWIYEPKKPLKPSIKFLGRGDVGKYLLTPDMPWT